MPSTDLAPPLCKQTVPTCQPVVLHRHQRVWAILTRLLGACLVSQKNVGKGGKKTMLWLKSGFVLQM